MQQQPADPTAAASAAVKDFTAQEFTQWVQQRCRECNGDGFVDLSGRGLTDDSLGRLAEGLQRLHSQEVPPVAVVRELLLHDNDFSTEGLQVLSAEGLNSSAGGCGATLEVLSIGGNRAVTTLAPLVAAGVLGALRDLSASDCSLSVESTQTTQEKHALPAELCANLPRLERLGLCSNGGGGTVVLTAEALRALPGACMVNLNGSKVEVACPSMEKDGAAVRVALATSDGEEFGEFNEKTVEDICAFAGVQPQMPAEAEVIVDAAGVVAGAARSEAGDDAATSANECASPLAAPPVGKVAKSAARGNYFSKLL